MGNIKSIKSIGEFQTYDLEVDHPDHQFYLSNGILTSNSHSILYSMNSYRTAYLKAHYPIEFLLANLMAEVKSNDPDAKANIDKIKKEIRQNKVEIIPPDINKSMLNYTLLNSKQLLTGLDALKFVSDDAINDIINKRPFKSFFDFMSKVESRKVRANAIQALASSGCLDSFGISRKNMYLYCSDYRKKLQVWLKKHDPTKEEFFYPWPKEQDWPVNELYALEKFFLGESFICGKEKAFGNFFQDQTGSIKDVKKMPDKSQIRTFKAEVKDMFEFKIKKETSKYYGQAMIKATIEDINGDQCALTIFPRNLTAMQERIQEITKGKFIFEPGCAIHFSGTVNIYEDEVGIILENLYNFHPVPQLPQDLKARKVSLKTERIKKEKNNQSQQESLFEEVEDEMILEGLLDIDQEYDGDD